MPEETTDHFLRFALVHFHNAWSIRLFRPKAAPFNGQNRIEPGLVYWLRRLGSEVSFLE